MKMQQLAACVMAGCLASSGALFIHEFPAYGAQEIRMIDADDSPVEYRTEDEIRDFYSNHPFSLYMADTYDETPDIQNEVPGKLSDETVTNALNSLNFMRYIAGISSDVENNEWYENMVMAGTTLLTKVGTLTHTPKKPAGVSQEFYELGYQGTSSSNLGWGDRTLASVVINGWMNDGDASNIDRVGHRRWCLNPRMQATGFGHSGSYTGMYSFDNWNEGSGSDPDFVLWPGQTMPTEYFSGPWNISFSKDVYSLKSSDKSKIKITMTSEKTGKEYSISSSDTNASGKYMNLETSNYGYGPSLIFTPGVKFSAGDNVTVKITGLKSDDGYDGIQYTVHFFSMNGSGNTSTTGTATGTATAKKLSGISLNHSSYTLKPQNSLKLIAGLRPSDAADADIDDVEWYSSNDDVASVEEDGVVTAWGTGTAVITAELQGYKATCTITVSSGSSGLGSNGSGSSGGSGSGGSGSGGSGSGGSSFSGDKGLASDLPDYVVRGTWGTTSEGSWNFMDESGKFYKNCWAAIYNPYADLSKGQSAFDWFRFDTDGSMVTGWFLDTDGSYYYLNNDSDGTRGRMVTGWCWVPDAAGVRKCYYFNPNSDGKRGKMLSNTTVDGNTLNADGAWTVNGAVQTK